eukprot:scaffold257658_cov22-Tisochrysis_lutea.AAC.1
MQACVPFSTFTRFLRPHVNALPLCALPLCAWQVSDIGAFIDQLNDASELLSLGSGYYKVNANIDLGAPADSQAPGAQRLFSQRVRGRWQIASV